MAATTVTLTDDRAATLAALNAAIATFVGGGDTFISVPTYLGDSLGLSATPLASPNAYEDCTFIAIDNQDWRLDIAAVQTAIGTIPAGQGVRWSLQTRFGYNLLLIGVAFSAGGGSGTLEFNYQNNAGANFDTTATV